MGLRNRHLYKDEKCFFVTTTCVKWINLIDISDSYHTVEDSLNFVNQKYYADMLSYVIMPNHLHLLVYFKDENRLSDFMRDFKKFTSTMIRQKLERHEHLMNKLRDSRKGRSFQVWQDRFDDVCIMDKKQLEVRVDYIHDNPLQSKWNLVDRPELYQHSSAQYYELDLQPGCHITDYREYF